MGATRGLADEFEERMRAALGPQATDGRVWLHSAVLLEDKFGAQVAAWIQGRFPAADGTPDGDEEWDHYYVADRRTAGMWEWTRVGPGSRPSSASSCGPAGTPWTTPRSRHDGRGR